MKKVIGYVCAFVCVCIAPAVRAQQPADSSQQISEVVISGSRFDQFSTGSKTDRFDSISLAALQASSLADLLSQQSQVFIKSYGLGALASPSFRGSGAYHTAVMWNGFNLQNAGYGQFDFSLMPVEFSDEVSVQYGGNGALFGSGAVGGIVQLNSRAKYNSGFHAGVSGSAGSFQTYRQSVSLAYGGKKFYTTLKVFNQSAENNFTYRNTSLINKPEAKQTNAAISQQGAISENYFRLTGTQELNLRIWYQRTDRQIPPTMSMPLNVAAQLDESWRISSEWKWQRSRHAWYVRSAWFDETINYNDSITLIESRNIYKTNITEAELRMSLGRRYTLNTGITNTYNMGYSRQYSGWQDLNRFALFVSARYTSFNQRFILSATARQELIYNQPAPFIPSAGFEWTVIRHLRLSGNVAGSYRVPTLNDRYWIPGGNPDLKPEHGFGEELSLTLDQSYKAASGVIVFTAFNRDVNNWIIWLPSGSYWSPRNVQSVTSRGAECDAKVSVKASGFIVSMQSKAAFVLATNHGSSLTNDNSENKQLIYVPRITQQHRLSLAHKNTFIAYQHNYTGQRFTATDNSEALDAFQLAALQTGCAVPFSKVKTMLCFTVNNLWNKSYQAILERPMPGRNYLFTLTLTI